MPLEFVGPISLMVFVALQIWLYPHCVRPAMAYAGVRPRALWFAGAVTVLSTIALALLVGAALQRAPSAWRQGFGFTALIVFGIESLCYLRPRWIGGLTGGFDPTVTRRFLLDWLADHWVETRGNRALRLAATSQVVRRLVQTGLLKRDEMGREPLVLYLFALEHEPGDVPALEAIVEGELADLQPFDPLSRLKVVRRRRRFAIG